MEKQSLISRLCVCSILMAAASSALVSAAGDPSKDWENIAASTWEQRTEAHRFNQGIDGEQLVFPYYRQTGMPPFESSELKSKLPISDLSKVIWEITPFREAHKTYLAKRKELLSRKRAVELIRWCEQNKLHKCAEYELRCEMLRHAMEFHKPHYQALIKHWRKYADRRPPPKYSLPLPARGEWLVSVDSTGHHKHKAWAFYAFDLIIKKNGKVAPTNDRNVRDHYCWGQPIIAQADGVVVLLRDNFADNQIGEMAPGENCNVITVDYGGGVVGDYAHCKQGSAKVKVGQRVKAGQVLAEVGNSGASGMPHLHYSITDYGGTSIRGQYHFEEKAGSKWIRRTGAGLKEGTYVRNIAADDAGQIAAAGPATESARAVSRTDIIAVLKKAAKLSASDRHELLAQELDDRDEAIEILSSLFATCNEPNRILILEALGAVKARKTLPFLTRTTLKHPSRNIRLAAARAIRAINDGIAPDEIYRACSGVSPSQAVVPVEALAEIGDSKAEKFLSSLLASMRKHMDKMASKPRRTGPPLGMNSAAGRSISVGSSSGTSGQKSRQASNQILIDALEAALVKLRKD